MSVVLERDGVRDVLRSGPIPLIHVDVILVRGL